MGSNEMDCKNLSVAAVGVIRLQCITRIQFCDLREISFSSLCINLHHKFRDMSIRPESLFQETLFLIVNIS